MFIFNRALIIYSLCCGLFVFLGSHAYANINKNHIEIISISYPPNKQASDSCESWRLNKNEIKDFFELSTEYKEENSYSINYYNILNCNIEGLLILENEEWEFTVNQGGIGYWTNKNNGTRMFGCEKSRCDHLDIGTDDAMAE